MRKDLKLCLIAPLLCIGPMAASADEGDATKLTSECGAADLPQASVDGCLERVRVLEETEPSPQLQTLEAALEQREGARPARAQAAAAPAPRVVEVAPRPLVSIDEKREEGQASAQAGPPGPSTPRSDPAFEDEPPVSDPPDVPIGTDSAAEDDTHDPPQS